MFLTERRNNDQDFQFYDIKAIVYKESGYINC